MEKITEGKEVIYIGVNRYMLGKKAEVIRVNETRCTLSFKNAQLIHPIVAMSAEHRDLVLVEDMKIKPLTLAIDFDETIIDSGGNFPQILGVREGAREAIEKLYRDGHYIIINTCRTDERQHEAEVFLYKNQIPYHAINRHNPANILFFKNDTRKIGADLYIDDKNLESSIYGLPAWSEIYDLVTVKAVREYLKSELLKVKEESIEKPYTISDNIEQEISRIIKNI
jgi:hypothetical protein